MWDGLQSNSDANPNSESLWCSSSTMVQSLAGWNCFAPMCCLEIEWNFCPVVSYESAVQYMYLRGCQNFKLHLSNMQLIYQIEWIVYNIELSFFVHFK